jgi:hypothetical protein
MYGFTDGGNLAFSPGVPCCDDYYPQRYYSYISPPESHHNKYQPYTRIQPYNNYHPRVNNPSYHQTYDRQSFNADYSKVDGSSENEQKNSNALATENLAGAKSENANENANMGKGGEAFGFGALESDNRNLLANENNIEVANANKNELGVEVANFNANENSAQQESAALAETEVMNEAPRAYFTDYQENESQNLNLNDNYNDRPNRCRGRGKRHN